MVVPFITEAFTNLTPALSKDDVEMAVNTAFDERDRKRSVYSISKCPDSKEAALLQKTGLQWLSLVYDEVLDDSLTGYQWSSLTEKHPDQRKEYIKYLTDNLSDTLIKDGKPVYFIEDTASKRTLLDCNDQRRMPFAVKGSADVMIVDCVAKQHRDIFAGLRLVIGVKKDATDVKNRWQLLLELIVSDLKSEKRRAPVGLLTDLNNNWYFLWFSADKEIVRYTLSCPANAFKNLSKKS